MSIEAEPRDPDDRTTVEVSYRTLDALDKLQNSDETRDDAVRAALRALKDADPERLQVDL